MEKQLIQQKFNDMGAAVFFERKRPNRFRDDQLVSIDVVENKKRDHFVLENPGDLPVEVLDIQPDLRHLLLLVRGQTDKGIKDLRRFLCGHDERHWFVAAIPEDARVSTVKQAVEALKPGPVKNVQERVGVKTKDLHKRRTAGYVRQGEWFFVQRSNVTIQDYLILINEPLRRGRGKPHIAEFLYRSGGYTVYVSRQYPNGLTEKEYRDLITHNPRAKKFAWRTMRRNATVLVKGRISHPDHATIVLDIWHEVVPNTESESVAFRDVAFLD